MSTLPVIVRMPAAADRPGAVVGVVPTNVGQGENDGWYGVGVGVDVSTGGGEVRSRSVGEVETATGGVDTTAGGGVESAGGVVAGGDDRM